MGKARSSGYGVARARAWLTAALALGSGCDVTLARDLPEAEAEAWVRGLDRVGVAGRVEPEPRRAAGADAAGSSRRLRVEVAPNALPDALAWAIAEGSLARGPSERAREQAATPLIETRAQARAREAVTLARALEQALEQLPHVERARVVLSLPVGIASLPELAPPLAASVLLLRARAIGATPLTEEARALVAGAVPGLATAAVTVVESAAASAGATPLQLQRVGPLSVARPSAPLLRGWLIGSLLLHILLAAALLWPLLRRRAGRDRAAGREREQAR